VWVSLYKKGDSLSVSVAVVCTSNGRYMYKRLGCYPHVVATYLEYVQKQQHTSNKGVDVFGCSVK